MTGLPFAFLNPFVLFGLISLPVLWFILRFLPPAPKKIFLPTARFLLGLNTNQTTPDTAPWWLILLRLSILASLILAFAGPIYNPQKPMAGSGPLRLVFDNGWASAQTWNLQIAKAEDVLQNAITSNRPVLLQFTATKSVNNFIRADQALEQIRSIEPQSWPGNPAALKTDQKAETIWISSGLSENGFQKTAEDFTANGLTVFLPDLKDRPGILRGASGDTANALVTIETVSGGGERSLTVQGFDARNRLINQLKTTVSGQTGGENIIDESGLFADKPVAQWKVPNFAGAGGILLNNTGRGTGLIGIVSQVKTDQPNDFSDASFYLTRAAEPFAKIESGSIEELIKKNCTVLVLPDIASFSPATLAALEKWIKSGGVALRFGGKSMSEADNVLIPVPLKTGLRSLSGDLTWEQPLKVSQFTKTSPFANTAIPDISVERQLLAEPSADLESHVWAKLSDGTPFITARSDGRGLIILVHTTATPDWSDFVLSGFYVSFLKEILELSSLPDKSAPTASQLQPSLVFNGWGQLVKPGADVKSMTKAELETLEPSAEHPPGFYGDTLRKFPFNLGDHIANLNPVWALPQGANSESLNITAKEQKLSTFFFLLAAILFLIDWLLLIISTRLTGFRLAAVIVLCLLPVKAHAQSDMDRASSIHLACIKTTDDRLCLNALHNLSVALKMRTSIELGDPVIVDLEKDDLSFYPLLYWPVDTQQTLTPKAREAFSNYIGKGGMVLIDTRDGAYSTSQIMPSPAVSHLREMLQGIEIPPLKPASANHVLFKSFYLLNLYPEYNLVGKIWVEEDSLPPEEELSSVLIRGEDWIQHWGFPQSQTEGEMSTRFGINLMIYALTGNYKSDQVHMKAILERMGH